MPKFSIKTRLRSFKYAFNGIFTCVRTQHNFWIHLVAAALVVMLGFVLDVSSAEWLFLVFAIAMVLVLEIINTAIENVVDILSPEHQKAAGIAKDMAAGAVLVAAIAAAIIGLIIFLPKLLALF